MASYHWRKFSEDELVVSEDGKTKSGLQLHEMTVHWHWFLHCLSSHDESVALFTASAIGFGEFQTDQGAGCEGAQSHAS